MFLQEHRPSVRMGSEHYVFCSTNGTHVQASKATVSSSRVFGRLIDMLIKAWEGNQYEGLPEGGTGDRQVSLIIRLEKKSDEAGMGRKYPGGAPWLRGRLGSRAFLHSAAKNCQGT
jgi:hypothetical protein